MIEVSKAVIEKNGQYLLLKRAPSSKTFPMSWDFAGGKHDPGEIPLQAVLREVKEETNYDIDAGKEVKTKTYQHEGVDLLFHYFIPTSFSGELVLSEDHVEYKWFTREEIDTLSLHPCVMLFFE